MDKKSLVFVVLLTFGFLMVNHYFDSRRVEQHKEQLIKEHAHNEERVLELTERIEKRRVPAEELPIAVLYSDAEGNHALGYAALVDDALLTFQTIEPLPQTIYARLKEDKRPPAPFMPAIRDDQTGSLLLYRKSDGTTLPIAPSSVFEPSPMQLISMENGAHYVSDYSNGQFTILREELSAIKEELGQPAPEFTPPAYGIVVKKVEGSYYPVGVYDRSLGFSALNTIGQLEGLVRSVSAKNTGVRVQEESYYVLETEFQQLVFTSRGGALSEINLIFNTRDEDSVVKKIEFDRIIAEQSPQNALFPIHPYYTPGNDPQGPYKRVSKGVFGGYYPLLRRDLINTEEGRVYTLPAALAALNIVSQYPELAKLHYEVTYFDAHKIVFEAKQSNRRIIKTYTVDPTLAAPYCLDLSIDIEGDARGLWLTTGVPEVEWINGAPAPALKVRNKKGEVESLTLPDTENTNTTDPRDWICNSNGFFGLIADPLTKAPPGYRTQIIPGGIAPSRLILVDQTAQRFVPDKLPGYTISIPLNAAGGTMKFRVFSGPFADSVLRTVDQTFSNPKTGYNPDYLAAQSYHGFFTSISKPIMKILFFLMNFFHSITGSWALSIVLLTVVLRIVLYPLNAWSTKSTVKMQKISPRVSEIQKKYKSDPKKMQMEVMSIYRTEGVNPLSGCFPMLIQLPFLISMFDLLKSTFELRGASFIPGWIDNLAAPDVLFSWNYSLPLIGNQFHLLPIFLGAVMFIQQRFMSTASKNPDQMTDQQRQQAAMGNIMAVVFTVMFWNFPSGLCIYWLSSMLLGIGQQWWTQKQMSKSDVIEVSPVKGK